LPHLLLLKKIPRIFFKYSQPSSDQKSAEKASKTFSKIFIEIGSWLSRKESNPTMELLMQGENRKPISGGVRWALKKNN